MIAPARFPACRLTRKRGPAALSPVLAGIRARKSDCLTFLCASTVVVETASRLKGGACLPLRGQHTLALAGEAALRVSRLTARADSACGHQNIGIISLPSPSLRILCQTLGDITKALTFL